MSSETPDRAAILEALTLLGAPNEALAAFPVHPDDLAFSFADALVDAPAAIYTDWRFHPGEALNDVWQRLYPHGVKGMIDEEDEDSGFPKKIILQHAGIGTRYRIRIKDEEPCLHDILFALEKVLPAELQVLSLLPYKATDTYLHVIQPAPVLAKVRDLLGEWFSKVFAVHASPLTFTKTGGNVKPKRNLAKNWIKRNKEWLAAMESECDKSRANIDVILECRDIEQLYTPPFGATPEQQNKDFARFVRDFPLPRRFFPAKIDFCLPNVPRSFPIAACNHCHHRKGTIACTFANSRFSP
jgi:hypothetical protein